MTNTTATWNHAAANDEARKHKMEHGARQQQENNEDRAKRVRVFLVVDTTDALDPPCTATAGEAADALQIDVDALRWAIEEHGRCDGERGMLVVPLTGHEQR